MVFPLLKKVCIRRRERKKRGKKEKKELKKKKEKQKMTLMEKKYLKKKKKKIYCGRGENPITNCEEGPALGSRGRPREWGRGYIFPVGIRHGHISTVQAAPCFPAPLHPLWACSRVGGHGW